MFAASSAPGVSAVSPLAAPVSATPQAIGPAAPFNNRPALSFPSLLSANINNFPLRFPQPPIGAPNTLTPNSFAGYPGAPGTNPSAANIVQNLARAIQNQADDRRLARLEEESVERQNLTSTLQQMGTQIVQGQKDILEQVLEYQYIVQQCLDTLDHQEFILSGQNEELGLLRARMEKYDYLIDAFKENKEQNRLARQKKEEPTFADDAMTRCRNLLSLHARTASPFSQGGVTRVTATKFQPLNLLHRPSNKQPPNTTSAIPNATATNTRPPPPSTRNFNN